MADIDTVYIKVRPDLTGFESSASSSLRKSGAKAGKTFGTSFGHSFKSTLAGVTGGLLLAGGIEASFRSGIRLIKGLGEAAKEEQLRATLLSTSLRNLGTSTTLFGQALDDVIEKESRAKGFTDTQLTDAFIRLNTVTKDSAKAYKLLQLAEDISRQRKMGLTQSALLLSRAEMGVFTSLRRVGIAVPQLSAEEAKLSKERQKRILTSRVMASLEEKFGGTALAVAQTATGATDRLGVAVQELKEDIGRALLPSITNVSNEIADWLGTEEHQAEVQRRVNEGIKIGGEVAHGFAGGIKAVKSVTQPLVDLLGGTANAVRLLVEAMAVGKVLAFVGALKLVGPAAVTAGAGVATAEAEIVAGGGAAVTAAGRVGLLRGALLRLGAIGAVAYGVDKVIQDKDKGILKTLGDLTLLDETYQKITGQSFGGGNGSSAVKKNLTVPDVFQAIQGGFLNEAGVRALEPRFTSPEQFKAAIAVAVEKGVRDASDVSAGQGAVGESIRGGKSASVLPMSGYVPSTDAAYRAAVAKAKATSTTADEEALYRSELQYVDRQVARLEKRVNLTKKERSRLVQLYGEKAQLQDDITSIEDANTSAASDAVQAQKDALTKADEAVQAQRALIEQRLQNRLTVAQATATQADDIRAHKVLLGFYAEEEKRLRAQGKAAEALTAQASRLSEQSEIKSLQKVEQDRLDQEAKDRKQRMTSLREQRLQLRVQLAELTKTSADDIKAQQALVKFYGKREVELREQGALSASLTARSNKIAAMLEIKNLKSKDQSAGGTSATEFFQQAISNFKQFGGNIAGSGGILSGQDARGAFAALALAKAAPDRTAQILAVNSSSSLTEQQKQTRILQLIAASLRPGQSRAGKHGSAEATRNTRTQATVLFGGSHGEDL